MNRIEAQQTDLQRKLNWVLDQFESDWHPESNLLDYVSIESGPTRTAILVELIRVDMELHWSSGKPKSVQQYLDQYGCDGQLDASLDQLYFEEFRLRRTTEPTLSPDEYRDRYGVDVSAWESGGAVCDADSTSQFEDLAFPETPGEFHGFQLVGLLGRGAFGRVYLARQPDLASRFVVLKVTEINDAEPAALARLQHTHIVPIFSMRRDDRLQSICMPYLGIVTLADLLKNPLGSDSRAAHMISTVAARKLETLKTSDALRAAGPVGAVETSGQQTNPPGHADLTLVEFFQRMMFQLAEALDYAHAHGVVHGDLKPANILIGDDGIPMLLDFHLASQQRGAGSSRYTAGGTLPYMSVAQLRHWQGMGELTPRCDLFALGAVMYQTLTGKLPYPVYGFGDEDIERMIDDRRRLPEPVHRLNPRVSPTLSRIIHCCLDQRHGYQDAAQLCHDLKLHLEDRPVVTAGNPSLTERLAKWKRRHPRVCSMATATAFFLILTAGFAAAVWSRWTHLTVAEAVMSSRDFQQTLHRSVVPLTASPGELNQVQAAASDVQQQLEQWLGASRSHDWRRWLPPSERQAQTREIHVATFWLARAWFLLALNERSVDARQRLIRPALDALAEVLNEFPDRSGTLDALRRRMERQLAEPKTGGTLDVPLATDEEPTMGDTRDLGTYLSLLALVDQFRTEGKPEDAIDVLNRATRLFPDDVVVWMLKGHTYLQNGQAQRAAACYEIASGLAPDSPWGFYFMGRALMDSRQWNEAERSFSEALEQNEIAAAFLNRALVRQRLGKYQLALADIERAERAGPVESRVWLIKSHLLQHLGRREDANHARQTFISTEPDDVLSWNARGIAHVQDGRLDLALSDFQKALELDPDRRETLQNLAALWAEKRNDPGKAVEALSRMLERTPNDPVTRATRGVLFARMKDETRALEDAKEALRVDRSADTLYRVAGIFSLLAAENPPMGDTAIRLLRRAALLDGNRVLTTIDDDPDLAPLRAREDFQELRETLKRWQLGSK